MKYGTLFLFAVLAMLGAGCISYEYDGKEGPAPKDSVQVYGSPDAIRKSYTVLGKATVSGNTENISRDRLVDRLVKEAGKKGADAILIVEQQVVPNSDHARESCRYINDNGSDNSNYGEICRDMDTTYGNLRHRSETESQVTSYRRIIRAEYLVFNGTPDKAPAADAKSAVKKATPAPKAEKDAPAPKAESSQTAPAAK